MPPERSSYARLLQPLADFPAAEYRWANVRPVPVEIWDPRLPSPNPCSTVLTPSTSVECNREWTVDGLPAPALAPTAFPPRSRLRAKRPPGGHQTNSTVS